MALAGGRVVPYTVQRSVRRRRSYGFVVSPAGVVVFKAPRWIPLGELLAFGTRRQRFIVNRLDEIAQKVEKRAKKAAVAAELEGRWCALPEDWYKRVAKQVYPVLVKTWAAHVGVTVQRVRVTSGAQVWGSCTSAGTINLSWRLLQVPEALREYVVVHEVCHRVHMNHGPRFWALVEKYIPDYAERRKEMNRIGGEIG